MIVFFVGLSVNGIRRIQINSNIYDIFPSGQEYADFARVMNENNFTKQVVFSVSPQESMDSTLRLMEFIVGQVQQSTNTFTDFNLTREIDQGELVNYLQKSSIANLGDQDFTDIQNRWSETDSVRLQMQVIKDKLTGPQGLFFANYFAQDPLGISAQQLKGFGEQAESPNYLIEDGLIFNKSKDKVFFFANLNCLQGDDKCSFEANNQLISLQSNINEHFADANFEAFATFQIAVENQIQVKQDTLLTVSISVSLILFILFLFYRKISAPLVFMIPCVFGVMAGLGFVGYYHPNINGISIATASVLLGIVLDYSFHFFTHLKHSKSIITTIKDISFPMLVGSFTTVGAFASLLFTNSAILQNFGLIALVTLLGAAFFTIIGLPVILQTIHFEFSDDREYSIPFPRWMPKILTGIIAIGSLVFIFNNATMKFDADLNNLAYHPAYLKDKERDFTGIDPSKQKKVFVFSKGDQLDEVKKVNGRLFDHLSNNRDLFQISEVVSTAPYLISKNDWKASQQRWLQFWSEHQNILTSIQVEGEKSGFSSNAFAPFMEFATEHVEIEEDGRDFIQQMGMTNLVHDQTANKSILSIVVLDKERIQDFKSSVSEQLGSDVFVMDIADLSAQFLLSLKDDFNYLLVVSSALVFFSLLIIYGRIELSLFAFAPMALSWLWIVGCGNILGLEFNFVNIIIVTFIFGLGDDFSIFVTDGLMNKSRYGSDQLSAYKKAIILSGITTIIGTGVLIFAQHPAIKSVGGLSILGIGLIMILTLVVQPFLYDLLIFKRKEKGKGPITVFNLIWSIFCFILFFNLCVVCTAWMIILMVTPLAKTKKQLAISYFIYFMAKMVLFMHPFASKKVLQKPIGDSSNGKIWVANHSSFIDILALLSETPKMVILVKEWVYNSPIFGPCIRFAGYPFSGDGTEKNLELIQQKLEAGYQVVIFPEGTRSVDGNIGRFHKGAFLAAKQLNVKVQPVVLVGLNWTNPKNDIMINPGEFYVKYLPELDPNDFESYQILTKHTQAVMRSTLKESLIFDTTARFWRFPVLQNYLLKGPILEWYVRVKYHLEAEHYISYNRLIGNRKKIYDIGCGLGYLDFLLHYSATDRQIVGIDADEEKILTASNGLYNQEQLSFVKSDVVDFAYESADVFIINDLLHYLSHQQQEILLSKVIEKLNPNGLLIIREGIKDGKGAENTRRTEIWSSKILKFNTVENNMAFLSDEFFTQLSLENGLTLEKYSHSTTTSNHLFVFTKNGAE